MKFLLDTHVLLWSLFSPKKISKDVRLSISDIRHTVLISPISLWEISIKYTLKKLDLGEYAPEDLLNVISLSGYEYLCVRELEAASFYKLSLSTHKDPFDRMLIWQSIKNEITLISRDSRVSEYKKLGLKFIIA